MPWITFTASRIHVATYLCCIALFSISFLVFLNSSISFVVTERIGDRDNVGNAVGDLGFADELFAIVACPFWGLVSDRIGVRTVAVLGYAIVGCSLFILVQAKNVYPQLLLARVFFSLGGAATATMVTAVLPAMTYQAPQEAPSYGSRSNGHLPRHNIAPSISSELTITPARWRSRSPPASGPTRSPDESGMATSRLAGLVGMFTGMGALIALLIFLPLPAKFQEGGQTRAEAVASSFYVVGAVAFAVSLVCLLGLRNLPGENDKSLRNLFSIASAKSSEENHRTSTQPVLSYFQQLLTSFTLGFQDRNIGLGYLGGFVARASSVAISLFIPLFVNAYFIRTGRCPPTNTPPEALPPDFKESCRRAYILAATLTGSSQLVALLCAPLYGYFSSKSTSRFNIPLLTSSLCGIAGYVAFALVTSPDPRDEQGSGAIYFIAALIGISQIGAIVCSLSLLGRGIQGGTNASQNPHNRPLVSASPEPTSRPRSRLGSHDGSATTTINTHFNANQDGAAPAESENAPLLANTGLHTACPTRASRTHLKGSIAGVYSLLGGFAILLLTKLGGALFDSVGKGAPFWMMAAFNAILAVGTVAAGLKGWVVKDADE